MAYCFPLGPPMRRPAVPDLTPWLVCLALVCVPLAACRRPPRAALRIASATIAPSSAPPVARATPPVPLATTVAPSQPTAAATSPTSLATVTPAATRFTAPVQVPAATGRPPLPERDDPGLLAAILAALGDDAPMVSVAVRRLSDGRSAAWQGEHAYYAASLYKLAVLYEAYRQRELGLLDFARTVPVTEPYVQEDLGTLAFVPREPNGDLRIADAVRAMITLSDNTSATILLDLLGHRNVDATLAALGLLATSVNTRDLPTTATDMARLMTAIVSGEGLSAASAQEMVNLLLAQHTRLGIPRGIPATVPVGNKTGTWDGALHDVAVVYAPNGPFVIAVLTDGSGGWEVIRRVAAAVYRYLAADQ